MGSKPGSVPPASKETENKEVDSLPEVTQPLSRAADVIVCVDFWVRLKSMNMGQCT